MRRGITHHIMNSQRPITNSSLTQIRGIGATKRQWLESLGILTVHDLANAVADELKEKLKAIGNSVSKSEIEGWITQAQAVIPKSQSIEELVQLAGVEKVETADALNLSMVDEPNDISEWHSVSTFKVDFSGSFGVELQTCQMDGYMAQRMLIQNLETTAKRMMVQHLESGMNNALVGIAETELQQWILNRLQANLQLESLVVEAPEMGNPIALEITQLRIVQSSNSTLSLIANKTKPLFPDGILADRSFDLEVTIVIPDVAIADLHHQLIVLAATCEARHLTTGAVTQWGEARMNVIGGTRSIFTLTMRDLMSTELGAYRLKVFATIQNLAATEASFKVPVVEVESPNPPSCYI